MKFVGKQGPEISGDGECDLIMVYISNNYMFTVIMLKGVYIFYIRLAVL